ncbi:hypothetical protein BJY04DRAFT_176742 [Aspergillus karnatakaensis]|uniref:FAD-binding oxidoreductase n=1 Tax=Aspergillus karnatakaensis TaxID=1810916 RepID=UPI003CCD5A92
MTSSNSNIASDLSSLLKASNSSAVADETPIRWSQLGVSRPAATVIPSTEEEIISVLNYAATKKLQVIAVTGARAPFVPVTERSLLLDMRNFRDVSVRPGSVTFGGGSVAGDVIRACAAEQCYTLAPNSNAVGMVGFLLGGGSSPFNGIHGLAADNIIELKIITANGRILTLSSSSSGEEGDLFRTIRGAGHGLGIITSVTMPCFPMLSLSLTDNCAWIRRVTFPLTAIDEAAVAFLKLQTNISSRSINTLMFLRAPPNAPNPGQPIIALTAVYYGPVSDAEQSLSELFDPQLLRHSSTATTSTVPLAKMNDATAFLDAVGGYKQIGNTLLGDISLESIRQGAKAWLQFGDDHPDAKARTVIFWGNWTRPASLEPNMFLPKNDRKGYLQVFVWYTDDKTIEPATEFMDDVLRIAHQKDKESGLVPATHPNNQLLGGEIDDAYSKTAIQEIRRVKALWDADGLFWSPAVVPR